MIGRISWLIPLALIVLSDVPGGSQGTPTTRHPQATQVRNKIGMWLAEIPAGSFDMGSSVGPGEAPVHRVSVRSFWMGVTEVTQAQWQVVMGTNPSHFREAGPNAPVEMVTWDDAQAFAEKLSAREPGWRYRLPSEAEWEYACLARTAKDPYGPGEAVAWIKENSGGTTHPVGLKQPNAFGLHDMFGNVPEWTQDTWHADYTGAPTDGSAWEGGDSGYHTLRGGGWDLPAFFLHAALRGPYRRDSPPRVPRRGGPAVKENSKSATAPACDRDCAASRAIRAGTGRATGTAAGRRARRRDPRRRRAQAHERCGPPGSAAAVARRG